MLKAISQFLGAKLRGQRYSPHLIPPIPAEPCYVLSDVTLIGYGDKRAVHLHPGDPRLCIKVARHPDRKWDCLEQSVIEWIYFSQLERRGLDLRHALGSLGWVNTNMGAGLVFKRAVELDGTPAMTLSAAVGRGLVSKAQVESMLAEVRDWAVANAILVADINIENFMLTGGRDRLVFVDGLGGRRLGWRFGLYRRLAFLSRFKTLRRWQRRQDGLRRELAAVAPSGAWRTSTDAVAAGYRPASQPPKEVEA